MGVEGVAAAGPRRCTLAYGCCRALPAELVRGAGEARRAVESSEGSLPAMRGKETVGMGAVDGARKETAGGRDVRKRRQRAWTDLVWFPLATTTNKHGAPHRWRTETCGNHRGALAGLVQSAQSHPPRMLSGRPGFRALLRAL